MDIRKGLVSGAEHHWNIVRDEIPDDLRPAWPAGAVERQLQKSCVHAAAIEGARD